MVLETIDDPRIGIGALSVPESEGYPYFDLEAEVNDEDWERIKIRMAWAKDHEGGQPRLAMDVARGRVFLPNRFSEIGIDEEVWSYLKNGSDNHKPYLTIPDSSRQQILEHFSKVVAAVEYAPERRGELGITQEIKQKIIDWVRSTDPSKGSYNLETLSDVKLVFPDLTDKDLGLDEEKWALLIERLKIGFKNDTDEKFLRRASLTRLGFPDNDWKSLVPAKALRHCFGKYATEKKKLLYEELGPGWSNYFEAGSFFDFGKSIAILQAKDVKIDEHGLHLVAPSRELSSGRPESPEERNF